MGSTGGMGLSLGVGAQEGEFVGFLQLVQLLVTIAMGNRRIFFSLLFIHQTLHWHDTQQGKSLSLLSLIPAWMRYKRAGTDTKISTTRVGVRGVGGETVGLKEEGEGGAHAGRGPGRGKGAPS